MSLVVLFDIDGTLVDTGGAGRRAMVRAFDQEHGSAEPLFGLRFGGMTDYAIVRTALEALGVAAVEESRDRVLARYLEYLPLELAATTGYVVHPGVPELLAELERLERIAVGLGTGNIEPGARRKLAVASLDRRFTFGGFGSDHEERAELVRMGAERGAGRLGVDRARCRVVVVGDTIKDVAAAHAIGAQCLAVCTGAGTRPELEAAGAELCVDDLHEPLALEFLRDG
jgi:phosphoglycolate phosphatase-like HAD superfamily hydrolase